MAASTSKAGQHGWLEIFDVTGWCCFNREPTKLGNQPAKMRIHQHLCVLFCLMMQLKQPLVMQIEVLEARTIGFSTKHVMEVSWGYNWDMVVNEIITIYTI